jgi:hypothetical protein
MCKKLGIFLFFLLNTIEAVFAQDILQFPLMSKGESDLKDLVKRSKQEYSVHYQSIKYKEGAKFFIINHNIGSGIANIRAYVYLCGREEKCHLLTMRYSFSTGLLGELSSDGKELILKSEDGVVYLRMPFNWPRPPV